MMDSKEMAEAHWAFLEKWLHMVYVDAFVHGFRHGAEHKSTNHDYQK